MPRYFQNMPTVGKAVHPNPENVAELKAIEEDIHARIREVGAQISEDYRGKCPILVGVLKGVVPFFAEMANAISIPVQEDFMCITSFEGGTESTGKLTFRKDIDHDIEGRHVLILEDIIDSGSTLKMICEMIDDGSRHNVYQKT